MNCEISTNPEKLDIGMVHEYLSKHAYWSKGIPLDTVKDSISNSLCFGVYLKGQQVGFARVITDFSTVAYLGDVFILPKHRGMGLSKHLMEAIMSHAQLQNLRRWILLTGDAHGLYKQFGWQAITKPELYMEVHNPNVYKGK